MATDPTKELMKDLLVKDWLVQDVLARHTLW